MANTVAALQTLSKRGISRVAGWLLLAILVCRSLSAEAVDCNDEYITGCVDYDLATQYIDANIGSSFTVKSSATNAPAVKINADQNTFTNSGTVQGNSSGAQGLRLNAAVSTVTNSGVIQGYAGSAGILVNNSGSNIGSVITLDNSGQIVGGAADSANSIVGNSGIRNLNTSPH